MDPLAELLSQPEAEKEARGLVFTPREIAQQPATWRKTYQDFLAWQPRVQDFLAAAGLGAAAPERPIVLLVGAGTSDYVGRSVVHLLRRQWQCEVAAVPSTDLLTNFEELLPPDRRYLCVSFSRSGDSSEGVAFLALALGRRAEARHVIVTCNQAGRMAREFSGRPEALCLVLDDATNDRGLAMTSSFSNMVVAGQCLAHFQDPAAYGGILANLAELGERLLAPAAELAARLAAGQYRKFCFLGSGALNGVAREAALKVLELTAGRIHTMSESFLGVRHGPLSALDDETLVVGFLSGDTRRQDYELDLLREIQQKKLGQKRVTVCPPGGDRARGLVEHVLSVKAGDAAIEQLPDEYRPPLDVMFGQLLGLFCSLRQGLKPDSPSPGGAISRVVEHVKIHQ